MRLSSVRIFGVWLSLTIFAASCAQLVGDVEIEGSVEQKESSNEPPPDAGGIAAPAVICEDGATRCEAELLQRCINGGTAWLTLEVCATPALCTAGASGLVSQCIRPACAVNQMSCEDEVLQFCNEDRNGWLEFDACESRAHCDAGSGQCLPAPCEPGQLRCNLGRLERCNADRTDWDLVDECETNELCEATRDGVLSGALPDPAGVGSPGGTGDSAGAPGAAPPLACLAPACVPNELRCVGNRLEVCDDGRTGWKLAEECATQVLCAASLSYVGLGERPRCVRPACAEGEHKCTDSGVLQVCAPGRETFNPIEACIGPAFCNAVEADQGRDGCLDARCAAGQMQCNGPQIQQCRADRTGFVTVGEPCETRDLCDDSNPSAAVCRPPVCQRGATSATEFRCQGATLQRCNDQHTGYENFRQCVTPGLCNAGFGLDGCRPPVCDPGQTRCNGDFLQQCNADRTDFVNVERCDPGTCDSNAGRCASPCIPGTAQCNSLGELEECRDRLIGREITARCGSPQLCDAATRTCRTPPPGCTADGLRRCRAQGQVTILEECTDGRSRFQTLDSCGPGEFCDVSNVRCDQCDQNSQATCEGNNLVTCAPDGQSENPPLPCQNGCQTIVGAPDRCRTCVPNSARCEGSQLVVCEARATEEVQRRNDCGTAARCQAELADCNAGRDGETCACTFCNPGETSCNGSQPLVCAADLSSFVNAGSPCENGFICDVDEGCVCAPGSLRCRDGLIEICDDNNRFVRLGNGRAQCDPSNPGVALSCQGRDSGQPTTEVCRGSTSVCVPGTGCAQCDPSLPPAECVSPSEQRICNRDGTFGTVPCPTGECREAAACVASNGTCRTAGPLPRGDACGPEGDGFCDGAPEPACVDCLDSTQCEPASACTAAEQCDSVGSCIGGDDFDDGTSCSGGVCVGGSCSGECNSDDDCGSGGECTLPGSCNLSTFECVGGGNARNGTPCGTGRFCVSGLCAGTCDSNAACDDGNPCDGVETCDPATFQCVNGSLAPLGTPCGDGQLCVSGACTGECTTGADCAPAGACSLAETCDPTTLRCVGGGAAPDGTACGDGQVCVGGACAGTCLVDGQCDDGDPCNGQETCSEATLRCVAGSALDDGSACGAGRVCVEGACSGECGSDADCEPAGECRLAETCDLATFQCVGGGPAPNGTACGNGQVCVSGACAGECDSPADCDDGDACDGQEACVSFQCVEGTPVTCPGGETCVDGLCVAAAAE